MSEYLTGAEGLVQSLRGDMAAFSERAKQQRDLALQKQLYRWQQEQEYNQKMKLAILEAQLKNQQQGGFNQMANIAYGSQPITPQMTQGIVAPQVQRQFNQMGYIPQQFQRKLRTIPETPQQQTTMGGQSRNPVAQFIQQYKQAGKTLVPKPEGGWDVVGDTRREERLAKQQEYARASNLRTEFINRPEIKDFVLIRQKAASMDAILEKAKQGNINNRVALDQALISIFNKVTDPNSVVRESEYARTAQNLPFVNAFSGAFAKFSKGGAGLTNKDREALVWGAKVIANEQGKLFNQKINEYTNLAINQGVNPENVITMPMFEDFDISGNISGMEAKQTPISAGMSQPIFRKTSKGNSYRILQQ